MDRFSDVPVSFALVTMRAGVVVSQEASLVDPGREVPPAATAVHGISTARACAEGIPLTQAVTLVAERLLEASRLGVPIVGMKLDYDLTMIDACYRFHASRNLADDGFRGPVLDALVLDRHFDKYRKGRRTLGDLCSQYGVSIESAHDAVADAIASLQVLSSMCRRYPELGATTAAELHRSQAVWHREWAESFSSWRVQKGLEPLDLRDADWPIALVGDNVAGQGQGHPVSELQLSSAP